MPNGPDSNTILQCTATIVSAHISQNATQITDIPELIRTIYAALTHVGHTQYRHLPASIMHVGTPEQETMQISVHPEYLICLEDGKKMKMLKRYLRTHYNMTPEEYRKKWGLPHDYPMVAPNYAKERSSLAITMGLGKKLETPRQADSSRYDKEHA